MWETAVQLLIASMLDFAVVFGAGFVLGPTRIVWVVPRLGPRMAELAEEPIMLVIIILAARWVVRRFTVCPKASSLLSMGGIALSLMLVVEFTLVAWLRHLSVRDYIEGRD